MNSSRDFMFIHVISFVISPRLLPLVNLKKNSQNILCQNFSELFSLAVY
jgi:hypothetical protein